MFCAGAVVVFAAALASPLERRRLSLVDRGERPESPGGLRAVGYGVVSVLAVGWMDLGVVLVSLGIPGFLLLAPFQPTATSWQSVAGPVAGALLLPVAAYPVAAWAGVRAAVARAVLFPKDRELREVVRSRARLVDAFETERRRIERDLHDGAQQRLVALTMKLGLAGLDLPPGSAAAKEVGEAHALAKEALAELRELIRGIHPQILTERGLPAAARRHRRPLARSPSTSTSTSPAALPAAVEADGVLRDRRGPDQHRPAQRRRPLPRHRPLPRRRARASTSSDDGAGGADPARGTGLHGLADRIAAADGRMLLSSPPGGPDTPQGGDPVRQSLRIVIAEDAVLLREGLVRSARALRPPGPRRCRRRPRPARRRPGTPPGPGDHRRPDATRPDGRRTARRARLLQAEQPGLAVLVLSQYVEQTFADELLDDRRGSVGTGYLLKERIGDVEEFADAVTRVAAGATVVDPEVVRQLLARRRDPLDRLTPREREVLALMAEGRSNAAIARRLVVTDAAVAKHIASILQKLDLPPAAPDDHRRVLAVLAYLRA